MENFNEIILNNLYSLIKTYEDGNYIELKIIKEKTNIGILKINKNKDLFIIEQIVLEKEFESNRTAILNLIFKYSLNKVNIGVILHDEKAINFWKNP